MTKAICTSIAAVMKARGKYIKDPGKDPGKLKLTPALADASTDHLTGAPMLVTTTSTDLELELIELTTRAPDYPTTFTAIQPTVCDAGTCDGSASALQPSRFTKLV